MRRRSLFARTVGLMIVGLFVSINAAFAHGFLPAPPGDDPGMNQLQRNRQSVDIEGLDPTVTLGQPGLSFAYTDTLGTTGVPYLYDHDHLYTPAGLATFEDQVWIAEYWGERVLKFNSDGSYAGVELGGAGTPIPNVSWLTDVTIDADGNVWVSVAFNSRVSVFDPSGDFVRELGGNGEFFNPSSVAFDSHGNVYVADGSMPFPFPNGNERIEIYSSSGEYINTIGVTGESGSDNEHFNGPHRIAIDDQDRLYVTDRFNHRVQVFDVTQPLTPTYTATLGVTGACASDNGHLCKPQGVAVDDDLIYVADTDNGRVQIFDIHTRAYVATIEGGACDVAIDEDGNIYVADGGTIVQQYNSSRSYVRSYGVKDVPYLTDGEHFYSLASLAATPDEGLLVLEWGGSRLVKLDTQGDLQWTIGKAGITGCGGPYAVCFPDDVTADSLGNVYLANGYIRIYDSAGTYLNAIGSFNDPGAGEYQFDNPTGVAVAADGTVYVADSGNERVQVYDSDRLYFDTLGETGVPGDDTDHFNRPADVAVDSLGNVYVADQGNHRVQVFDAALTYLRTLGEPGDNFGQFQDGMGLALDAQNRLYVTDDSGHVQVFDASGAFLTSIAAEIGGGLAVNQAGSLYLARDGQNDIQVFSPGVPGWRQANLNGFGDRHNPVALALEVFDNQLFATSGDWVDGAQVWRMETSGDWTAVTEPGFGSVYAQTNPAIPDMIVYDGQLYAGTAWWDGVGGQIWRSADGETWTQMEAGGFGDDDNLALTPFGVFDGMLYVGTQNQIDGMEIWRSATGDSEDWTRVVTAGNGDVDANIATGFIEFQDAFYVALENVTDGAEIWRTEDGLQWTRVITGGFGNSDNTMTGGLAILDGELYVGTRNETTGAQLFRTADGTNWDPVVEGGFGDINNTKIEMLFHHGGNLYAGTVSVTGIEVWQSSDGMVWAQANPDGFGDVNNTGTIWSSGVTSLQGSLYVSTINGGNGGEVWQLVLQQVFLPLVLR